MSEFSGHHVKNLTRETFAKLCESTELLLAFCRQRFFVKVQINYITIHNDIVNWCYNNCSDVYYIDADSGKDLSVFFLSEDDAALFKLTWCKDQGLSSK